MKFIIDDKEPKEEICKVSLLGDRYGKVKIRVTNCDSTFTLAILEDGEIRIENGFEYFSQIKNNSRGEPIVRDSVGNTING